MDNNLVTAIVTTHNRPPEMVLRAVNSVMSQTYNNIELIVVDDSTSDYPERNEVEDAVHKASSEIIYVKHKTTKGGCVARNTGLALAKGEYVAFLDDDDEWLPKKIEEQLKGFVHDKVALVYSEYIIIDETTGEKRLGNTKIQNGEVFEELIKGNFVGVTSLPLIKKEFLVEVGGFDELMQSSQDYDLWLRIAKHYEFNYIEEPLLNYYIHGGERVTTNVDKKIAGFERLNYKYKNELEKNDMVWYMRHRCLIPFYYKKYGRRYSILLWLQCVKKMPWQIVENLKYFLRALIGPENYFLLVSKWHNLAGR